jgi:hypothetical protein
VLPLLLFVDGLPALLQCARWLPATCSGEKIGGMGMSEPGSGTDVLAMRTTAKEQPDGSYLLNGSKMWITSEQELDSDSPRSDQLEPSPGPSRPSDRLSVGPSEEISTGVAAAALIPLDTS